MKCFKILFTIFIVLMLTGSIALAGGGIAGTDPLPCPDVCGVKNPGSGASAIKSTIAVEYHPFGTAINPGIPTVDFTLRLERSSDQFLYRRTIEENIDDWTDEMITCLILNACNASNPLTQDIVQELVNQIMADFFGAESGEKRFVITASSVSDTDFETGISERGIPGTSSTRAMSIANVKIYAIDNP